MVNHCGFWWGINGQRRENAREKADESFCERSRLFYVFVPVVNLFLIFGGRTSLLKDRSEVIEDEREICRWSIMS